MLARVTGPAREHDPPVGTGPPVSSVAVRRIVALFVLPYVLLGLWWALANPAIAAPDEDAHLVKALGMARFDIGVPNPAAPVSSHPVDVRNASITRVVEIPGRLDPTGYACFIFKPEATAACQPTTPRTPEGDVAAATTLGAYPPFLYPVAGWVASLGSDPASADRLGRLVVLAASALLLWLACASPGAVARPAQPGRGRPADDPDGGVLPGEPQHQCRRDPRRDRDGGRRRGLRPPPGVAQPVRHPGARAGQRHGPGAQPAAGHRHHGGAHPAAPGPRWLARRVGRASRTPGGHLGGGPRAGGLDRRGRGVGAALRPPRAARPLGLRRQRPRLPGAGGTAHGREHRLVRLARRAAARRRQPRLVRGGGSAGRHRPRPR